MPRARRSRRRAYHGVLPKSRRCLADWPRFDDRADEESDDAADDGADDRDEKNLAADPAAVRPEREEALGDEKRLEKRCDDCREYAGYDADQNVVRSPPHYGRLRVRGRDFLFLTFFRARAADLAAFDRIAAAFARELRAGDVIALAGGLGSGKTTFVASVVRALGNSAEVASPTFTFWHRYGGTPPVEHLDLYRIENPAEAAELGLEEALGPPGVAFVEWPDRLPGFVPQSAICVHIAGAGDEPRTVSIERP